MFISILDNNFELFGLMKNPYHSGTLAHREGGLTRMTVPGSNKDKSAADKASVRRRADAGDRTGRKAAADDNASARAKQHRRELGGPEGPDPTRYGDWERKGRCIDF
jgi:hypothetical protein